MSVLPVFRNERSVHNLCFVSGVLCMQLIARRSNCMLQPGVCATNLGSLGLSRVALPCAETVCLCTSLVHNLGTWVFHSTSVLRLVVQHDSCTRAVTWREVRKQRRLISVAQTAVPCCSLHFSTASADACRNFFNSVRACSTSDHNITLITLWRRYGDNSRSRPAVSSDSQRRLSCTQRTRMWRPLELRHSEQHRAMHQILSTL